MATKKAVEPKGNGEDQATETGPAMEWFRPTFEEAQALPLSLALTSAWMEFDKFGRTREGQSGQQKYSYAEMDVVLEAVMPTLAKYAIEITTEVRYEHQTPVDHKSGRDYDYEAPQPAVNLYAFLIMRAQKGGEHREVMWPIGFVDRRNKANGSNMTYARRYAFQALLNISPDGDTDGSIETREDRSSRRGNNRYGDDRSSDRDDRRSNFADRDDRGDPDAWRDEVARDDRGGRRDEGRERRDDERPSRSRGGDDPRDRPAPVRSNGNGPDLEKIAAVAEDSIRSAGNLKSCETYWEMFKKETKLQKGDKLYDQVAVIYGTKWKQLKADVERQKDPLGTEEPKDTQDKPKAPEPDVQGGEEHMSPEAMIQELQEQIENTTSIVELDRLLKEQARLIDMAGQFPPDAEAIQDMIDEQRRVINKNAQTKEKHQTVDQVEDSDRRENDRRVEADQERF